MWGTHTYLPITYQGVLVGVVATVAYARAVQWGRFHPVALRRTGHSVLGHGRRLLSGKFREVLRHSRRSYLASGKPS